jgi:hypothetical protein
MEKVIKGLDLPFYGPGTWVLEEKDTDERLRTDKDVEVSMKCVKDNHAV